MISSLTICGYSGYAVADRAGGHPHKATASPSATATASFHSKLVVAIICPNTSNTTIARAARQGMKFWIFRPISWMPPELHDSMAMITLAGLIAQQS